MTNIPYLKNILKNRFVCTKNLSRLKIGFLTLRYQNAFKISSNNCSSLAICHFGNVRHCPSCTNIFMNYPERVLVSLVIRSKIQEIS